MRILIAGGTSFVGRAIAWSALSHGHEVSVCNRGVTPSDLPASVERLVGDRAGDLSVLHGRTFDVTIDTVAYRPSDVTRLASALDGRGGFHLQISSVSAYREPSAPGMTEATGTLWDDEGLDPDGPITAETYGPLKAAAERAAARCFRDGLCVVRPTFVIGAHDKTMRFPYWVERARRGGVVAVPGPRASRLQYIDARDLADFCVHLAGEGTEGAFHAAAPSGGESFVTVMESVVSRVGPPGTGVRVVEPERVADAGLEDRFPLWSGAEVELLMTVDASLAFSKGLTPRPLVESVDDVAAWWGERAWPEHWLGADEEATLLGE